VSKENVQRYLSLRRNHPSWLLLASPKGPLILACLKALLDSSPNGVPLEEAVERLAIVFNEFANDSDLELNGDRPVLARKEIRECIRRGLIVERDGLVMPTDAFQRALLFLGSLDERSMTSTASRLATVQRAIETLQSQLSLDQSDREKTLRQRIAALEQELKSVQAGHFEVLDGPRAQEEIREVYQLAVSLPADFRRVEDSYREADRKLRQRIISESQNRGEIVDELLNGHDLLVQTAEGQVFESFHSQLTKSTDLQTMKSQLRTILENANADKALSRIQKAELLQLVSRLVSESRRVIQARTRSERDVRGFLKSGLPDEQMKVGSILQELFQVSLEVDWRSQEVRRTPGPLPAIAISLSNLPLVERILVKQSSGDACELELTANEADTNDLDAEFWDAYHALDREALLVKTFDILTKSNQPLTIGQLAAALPPSHDLETLAFWLSMARQAGIAIDNGSEVIELGEHAETRTRFFVPLVAMSFSDVEGLQLESFE